MALPGINILTGGGGLGRTVTTADGVAGLAVTGIAASGLALNTPAVVYNLAEAVALGITPATHPHAHGQISDFFEEVKANAPLWIIIVSNTETHANIFTADTGAFDKLVVASQGAITIFACSMGRIAGYTPTPSGLLDYAIATVAAAAQARAAAAAARFTPVFVLLDGTYLVDPLAGVTNIKGAGDRVSVFLGASAGGDRKAAMGRLLGRLAGNPIHYSAARVKTGYFTPNGFLTSGKALSAYSSGQLDSLHDAGYMLTRGFSGVFGSFVSDDVTLAIATSDYTSIANRRVMDKAIRLAYMAYVGELNDTVPLLPNGRLRPSAVSAIESVIARALEQNMVVPGNISGYSVTCDPAQDILATQKITVAVKIQPLGYLKTIEVRLDFAKTL